MLAAQLLLPVPAAVLEDPQKYQGKTVPVVGERISYPAMAQIVSDVTGQTIRWVKTYTVLF